MTLFTRIANKKLERDNSFTFYEDRVIANGETIYYKDLYQLTIYFWQQKGYKNFIKISDVLQFIIKINDVLLTDANVATFRLSKDSRRRKEEIIEQFEEIVNGLSTYCMPALLRNMVTKLSNGESIDICEFTITSSGKFIHKNKSYDISKMSFSTGSMRINLFDKTQQTITGKDKKIVTASYEGTNVCMIEPLFRFYWKYGW